MLYSAGPLNTRRADLGGPEGPHDDQAHSK